MAGGSSKRVSAESARSHTRNAKNHASSSFLSSGVFNKLLLVFIVGTLAWAYKTIQPPPPKICGSPSGSPITALRIKLRDGRHLAYKEHGVPKGEAKHKVVFVHGSDCCRHDAFFATLLSPDIAEGLGVYTVSFDRPGYGESDPNPSRTPKSLALDIEELADQLGLGSKFYVLGYSMGGQAIWACLKYISHRLAGATLVAPVVNYWWRNLPSNMSTEAYYQQPRRDQWALRVAHYAPWLTYWWNTQKWFPGSSVVARSVTMLSRPDMEIMSKLRSAASARKHADQVRQQGTHESLHRDMMVGFGKWDFDPTELNNPFPNNEGSVHLWQGDDDALVPVMLQRYIAQTLPWLRYHEVPRGGHMFIMANGMVDTIVKSLLTDVENNNSNNKK